MRTKRVAAVAFLGLAALVVPPTVADLGLRSQSSAPGPTAACREESWVAGTVDLCAGEVVYRDYLYDDYGADDPLFPQSAQQRTGTLSSTAGDARYATDVNSADLVELRVRLEGDDLVAEFELNALYNPGSTFAALAIDRDADSATGGGVWPVVGVRSTGWDVLAVFDDTNAQVDTATNTITGRLRAPEGATWRLQAVTGIKAGPVMNVAFRGTDEETVVGSFWDDKQAAALATGDISAFGHTVEVDDMLAGVNRPAPPVTGFHQRVYTSAHTLPPGEGMSYEPIPGRHGDTGNVCEQGFHFFGRYQPYGIYVPPAAPASGAGHGLQLVLHGCNANHGSLVDQPGMQTRMGAELDRILITPLGRGPIGYYSDISERDVLDVMADVEATHRIDRNRVFSGGYSMGGYGAYRMAALYPDRFAATVAWVGFTGDCSNNPLTAEPPFPCQSGAIGNVIDFVGNLRHSPTVMLYAGADELVHVSSATAVDNAFKAVEAPYIWYLHPAAEHLTFALVDDWRKEAAYSRDFVRIDRPARVTFRTDPTLAFPEYGIRHDRAYWLSSIESRTPAYTDLDLRGLGCGSEEPGFAAASTLGTDPLPWVSQLRRREGSVVVPQSDTLEGTLINVESVQVAVDDICLRGRDITYRITTDGPTRVAFSDGRSLDLSDAGEHEGVLSASASAGPVPVEAPSPAPSQAPPPAPAPTADPAPAAAVESTQETLAATGGPAGAAPAAGSAAVALLAAWSRRRRRLGSAPRLNGARRRPPSLRRGRRPRPASRG